MVVDILTHGLTAALLAYAFNLPWVVPFIVLGAVIIDTDFFFIWISDHFPTLYLFVHGGYAHSLTGAVVLSVIAWTAASLVLVTGIVHPGLPLPEAPVAFAAILAGALLHIGLDTLAVPGLPLLAPFSDRKFTAGLLPGPSFLLTGVCLVVVILIGFGKADLPAMILPYAGIIAVFLATRLTAFGIARTALRGKGRAVPAINPLRWLVIGETTEAWTVGEYRIGKGMGAPEYFIKYRSTSAGEISAFLTLAEVRRLRFHFSIVTAEKVGDTIIFSDPLRESGRIFYPPYYKRVRIPLPD